VTVLVAEPTLQEGLEPDAERTLAARCLAVVAAAVERHGGRIEHLEGTELAGTFGLPTAHEDDALRAARAASEIRDGCASIDAAVRCGIETGALDLVGDRLDEVSLDVARSVKDAASAGEILLGAAAFRLLAGAIDAVPAADARYRLLGLIEGAPAVRRRLEADLVGREAEFEQLAASIEAGWAGGAARSFVVLGEPGIGKTRLAAALVSQLRERARCLTGRCVPYGEGTTYLPLAEVIRAAVGPGDLRRNVGRQAAGMPDEDLVVERLVGAVAGDATAVSSSEVFWAVRRFLETLARERPLLIVLDDVHWAEPTLLDLVEYVAGWSEAPIAVLALARHELIETRPGWANGAITLTPLSDGAARSLLDALPERPLVGDDAVGTMLDSADGNPLFLEQIAAFAAERPLAPGEVPPSLETLLASRLDLLSEAERDVVERAAVAGREFSREAVDALSPPGEIAAVGPSLMALMRRRLVRPDRSASPGEDGFRFEHVLIRDAAYASIPKSRRAGMHERLARWLGAASARKELVGFHLEQACFDGDRNIQFRREAATVLAEAAEEAIRRLDTAAAVGLLRRAVSLVDVDDSLRRPLEIELGYALKNEGEVAESVVILTAVEEWARRTGDRHAGLRASIELAWPRLISGEISSAEVCALADEAISWFETVGDFRAAGRAARARANADDMLMRYGAAVEDGMRAAEFFERAGNPSFEVASQASALTLGPVPVDIVLDRVGSALADRTRSRAESGYLDTHVGHLQAMQGSFAAAREHIQQAERSHREFAQSFALVTVWPFGASAVELLAGDATTAEGILGLAIESLDPVENAAWFASLTAFRASALVQLARFDEALLLAETARATSPADDLLAQITWRQAISSAYARTGRWAEAEPFALDGVGLARPTEASCCLAESLLALAEVREAGGERAAAATLVEEALVLLHAKGNLARIQQLAGRRDPL
jgi:tetratricopeptide (TPR) repeat protein